MQLSYGATGRPRSGSEAFGEEAPQKSAFRLSLVVKAT